MKNLDLSNMQNMDFGTVSNPSFSNASGAHPSEFNLDKYNEIINRVVSDEQANGNMNYIKDNKDINKIISSYCKIIKAYYITKRIK